MKRSTDRIITTHAGSLPRPDGLVPMIMARARGDAYDAQALDSLLSGSVEEVVRLQVENGIDSVNDGELGKTNFTNYVRERLSGFETRPLREGDTSFEMNISKRDMQDFPEYFAMYDFFGRPLTPGGGPFGAGLAGANTQSFCTEPLRYVGSEFVQEDIRNFNAALAQNPALEGFLPANSPGTIEHWLRNDYYGSQEEFLFAIAEAMHEEYKAIVDAGLVLQIDDPDLLDGWQMYPEMSVSDYRKYAQLRVEALNHGLRDLPEDQVRLHVCWGSGHGPHSNDIALKDMIDVVLSAWAGSYSIEASNPVHEHEWSVFEEVKLPDGKTLVPGVIGHHSNFVEHPELVAERLVKYATLLGRENVIAGTDCGLGGRVAHPKIAWAKFRSMADGARIATRKLWGR
jgi:5-methyltetrahydropteroyltriglutamate--homocysteine methyltransferase